MRGCTRAGSLQIHRRAQKTPERSGERSGASAHRGRLLSLLHAATLGRWSLRDISVWLSSIVSSRCECFAGIRRIRRATDEHDLVGDQDGLALAILALAPALLVDLAGDLDTGALLQALLREFSLGAPRSDLMALGLLALLTAGVAREQIYGILCAGATRRCG